MSQGRRILKSGDITYMDEEIKPLAIAMNGSGWVRVISACAGHATGGASIESTNLFDVELDVLDVNKFEALKSAVNKRVSGVVWGGAMANNKIQYKCKDQSDKDNFIFLLKKSFEILSDN